jgi:hypothetical protein
MLSPRVAAAIVNTFARNIESMDAFLSCVLHAPRPELRSCQLPPRCAAHYQTHLRMETKKGSVRSPKIDGVRGVPRASARYRCAFSRPACGLARGPRREQVGVSR